MSRRNRRNRPDLQMVTEAFEKDWREARKEAGTPEEEAEKAMKAAEANFLEAADLANKSRARAWRIFRYVSIGCLIAGGMVGYVIRVVTE